MRYLVEVKTTEEGEYALSVNGVYKGFYKKVTAAKGAARQFLPRLPGGTRLEWNSDRERWFATVEVEGR